MKSVVVDVDRLRLGGRPAARPHLARDDRLRGAPGGLHRRPELGRRARRGAGRTPGSSTRSRTWSTSGSPRSSCCRSSRSTGWRPRPGWSTTGATSRSSFFAPHAAYASGRGADQRRGRVPRPGQGAPPGRHRGHPRRRLQPHRRGRRGRPDVLASAGWPTTTTTCSTRPATTSTTAACGNTFNANRPIVRRLIVDSLRYWVQEMHVDGFRFDLAAVLSRDEARPADGEPAGAVGHRDRPGPGRHEAHRRGVGRRRAVPGRQLRRRALGRVERPLPRRRPRLRQGRRGDGAGDHAALPRQPGHLRPQAPRAAGQRQLRDLPRRLHAQRPGLVRRQAQRVERRGQPRRQRPEPELELRRRGPDRRPRDRAAARAPGPQPPGLRPARRSGRRCC